MVDPEGRWLVAVQRGWASRDDLDAEAYVIASNRIPELGGWDQEELRDSTDRLARADEALLATITSGDRDPLLVKVRAHDRKLQGEEDPEPRTAQKAEPATRPGDVWQLGAHRLACVDSLEIGSLEELLEGDQADVILTDPPYAIYGSATGINSDIADDKMVRPFFESLGRTIAGNMRDFGHAYVHTDWRSWASLWEGFKRAGLSPKNCLVWDKGDFGLGANWPNAHEFVGFFTKIPPHGAMTSSRKGGQRQVLNHANILRFPRVRGEEREHNAAKPIALLAEILDAATEQGETVLDLFGGSGSTLIAAERTARVARVCEIEPAWCDVIAARWARETGQTPHRNGEPHDFGAHE